MWKYRTKHKINHHFLKRNKATSMFVVSRLATVFKLLAYPANCDNTNWWRWHHILIKPLHTHKEEHAYCICWWCCTWLIFSGFSFFFSGDYSALNLISRWHILQSPWVISFHNPTFSHIPPPPRLSGDSSSLKRYHILLSHHPCRAHRAFSPNPYSFEVMWLSYLTVRRNFSDKQPTWQQHEMGYSVFPGGDTLSWLEFLITYEKVTEESECRSRAFPRRREWVTCFLNLLLSSFKVYSTNSCCCWCIWSVCTPVCGEWKSKQKVCRVTCTHVHPIPRVWAEHVQSSDVPVSFSSWWTACRRLCWAARSHVMSSGSSVPLHKHKSPRCPRGFHPRRNALSPAVQGENNNWRKHDSSVHSA